eukprot:GILI01002152.1.p1 GENE.GILI01002152.1~~GILI01002152.1.p1  ORF type:complete len:584 (-),score=146.19 GILI01002152.1:109-1860(-)
MKADGIFILLLLCIAATGPVLAAKSGSQTLEIGGWRRSSPYRFTEGKDPLIRLEGINTHAKSFFNSPVLPVLLQVKEVPKAQVLSDSEQSPSDSSSSTSSSSPSSSSSSSATSFNPFSAASLNPSSSSSSFNPFAASSVSNYSVAPVAPASTSQSHSPAPFTPSSSYSYSHSTIPSSTPSSTPSPTPADASFTAPSPPPIPTTVHPSIPLTASSWRDIFVTRIDVPESSAHDSTPLRIHTSVSSEALAELLTLIYASELPLPSLDDLPASSALRGLKTLAQRSGSASSRSELVSLLASLLPSNALADDLLWALENSAYTDCSFSFQDPSAPPTPPSSSSSSTYLSSPEPSSPSIKAHKLVLSCASAIFATMFASGMREATGVSNVTLPDQDFSPEVFDLLLRMVYSESADLVENQHKWVLANLLVIANHYQLRWLIPLCEDALCPLLNFHTLQPFWSLCSVYDCAHLREKCVEFARRIQEKGQVTDYRLRNFLQSEPKLLLKPASSVEKKSESAKTIIVAASPSATSLVEEELGSNQDYYDEYDEEEDYPEDGYGGEEQYDGEGQYQCNCKGECVCYWEESEF